MAQNDLGQSTSPYLLQHADNPVHWKTWDHSVFETAKKSNKPILLSIGYAACHWCHVMAHESFEDQNTADLMNDLFINVKVDREEHPDVDALYQKALSVMGQQGGWPLTMFLTPDGEPFWGGTYFPKESMYGRPSFKEVLNSISGIFKTKQDDVLNNVSIISDALSEDSHPKGDGSLNLTKLVEVSHYIFRNIDQIHGGLSGAPKFPQPVLFDFLWRIAWVNQDETQQKIIAHTVDMMCLGGIYDHLGGGFARYSTDEEWLAPHFEKMLYDNALLISLMAMIWRKFPSSLYKQRIEETIDWALRDMAVEVKNGLVFAAALDADSEGVEGKFYVWNEEEIDRILEKNAPAFKKAYDVSQGGNWEEKNILRRINPFENSETEEHLKASRQKLFEYRKNRIAPGRDDKVLCDWNAMMIKSLCEAGLVFERSDWIDLAKSTFENLLFLLEKDGQLYHSWCKGKLGAKAYLEDYANLSIAALALYEVTGKEDYLNKVEIWTDHLNQWFWDIETGGYVMAAEKTVQALKVRQKPIYDNATPSGNGLMANVLCDLYHLSGKEIYKDRFNSIKNTFASDQPNEIFATPCLSTALIRFEQMETITIVGPEDQKETNLLINKASLYNSPNRKILLGDGFADYSPLHPLADKVMIDEKATAYVCHIGTCSAPITNSDKLEEVLNQNSL